MADIRIVPGSSIMSFTSSLNFTEKITQDASGSLNLYGSGSTGRTELFSIDGNNGRLFTVSDNLSDSLFSVNTIAGLPVIEAFANNTVVMGQYGTNALVVSGSKVGIGTTTPSEKLDVNGYVKATGFKTPSGTSTQFLMADGSVSTLTNPVTGTGTTNYLPKFTASGTIGNSLIYDNGSSVGINTTAPVSSLEIRNTSTTGSTITLTGANASIRARGYDTGTVIRDSSTIRFIQTPSTFWVQGSIEFATVNSSDLLTTRWSILPNGTFQSNGAGVIQTSASDLSLNAPFGNIYIVPQSNKNVGIGTISPTLKLEVDNTTTGEQCSLGIVADSNPNITNLSSKWYGTVNNSIKFHRGGNSTGGVISIWTTPEGGSLTERMRIVSSGNVGIGTTSPSYPLHVGTQVSNISIYAAYDIVAFSDKSVKENIRPIENVIKRIQNSRGVVYDRIDSGEKNNIGFIAQELEEQFPELIVENPDGTKAVKYQNAVAILFEAIKEQQKQINELRNGITD